MIAFHGQRALVTGGTRGIGRAIAVRLRELGAEVTVTGRAAERPGDLEGFAYRAVDFADGESTRVFCAWLEQQTDLPILVNNAGVNHIHRIEDYPDGEFAEVMRVNYEAVYRVSRSAARGMLAGAVQGRIVNLGSIWATNTKVGRSAYCASKAGVLGMTRGISVDLAASGILVNAVSPGFVQTELTERTMGADGMREISRQIPLGRLAEPCEIAEVVAFLVSPNNTYLTGQNIIVDGGFTNV